MRSQYTNCRTRLARIRCLVESLEAFKACKPLPYALCYCCKDVLYKCSPQYLSEHSDVKTHAKPISLLVGCEEETTLAESLQDVIPIGSIQCDKNTKFYASSEPMVTHYGLWVKVFAVVQIRSHADDDGDNSDEELQEFSPAVWIMARGCVSDETAYLVPQITTHDVNCITSSDWRYNEELNITNWMGCVEATYALSLSNKPSVAHPDLDTINELQQVPPTWSTDSDDQLIAFLSETIEFNNGNLGTIKNYVDAITVSSSCGEDSEDKLVDGNPETFWESDGNVGCHWIRLKMKKGTVISRLYLTLDMDDDNYLPNHVVVSGGELHDFKMLNDVHITLTSTGVKDECILQDVKRHYPYIEIKIKSCKDEGIDTRIRGIKIASSKEFDMGMSLDLFAHKIKMVRYPVLQPYSKMILYRRAQAVQRLVTLLDSVINFLVPAWCENFGSMNVIQEVKKFLPLSTRRLALIDAFIKESETSSSQGPPRLMINRRTAAEHKFDPTIDPEGNSSVFNQIFEGLKPRSTDERILDYKWPSHHDQWWECKFVGEGIIDQGGGFRDSLCDIAEELCPPSPDDPVPLPFFIRAPNQYNADANSSKDTYILNPCCKKFAKYKWIGQLMGACLRGVESIVLMLPCFVWKKLSGEQVSWTSDYATVDAAEVKLIDSLMGMSEDVFAVQCSERTWTVTLSDGSTRDLKPGIANTALQYEDRTEYAGLVKEFRMSESDQQIEAIREGLLSVVPEAVLNLLTWQEIEKRVCGDPEVSVEGIRKSTHVDEMELSDERIKTLFQVLQNFTNDDRSKFLRFVTGRKRLPCPVYISPYKSSAVDCLPESSTCSNTLYLPRYTSVKIAEEKIRYAAYNCIAIDTDLNPWD